MAYQWNGDDDYVERPANTHLKMTEEFHEAFDIPVARELTFPDTRTRKLRIELLAEELQELAEASGFDFEYKIELNVTREVDLIEIADALADIEYVTHGATLTYGLQEKIDDVFREVHRSNMAKLGPDGKPIYRESDRKVVKPPGWTPPDIKGVLGF